MPFLINNWRVAEWQSWEWACYVEGGFNTYDVIERGEKRIALLLRQTEGYLLSGVYPDKWSALADIERRWPCTITASS
jgi:hypothetical protein